MASDLTKEEIDDLRASFEMFDNDKSGKSNQTSTGLSHGYDGIPDSVKAVSRTLFWSCGDRPDSLE